MHVYLFPDLFKLAEMPCNGTHRYDKTKCQQMIVYTTYLWILLDVR